MPTKKYQTELLKSLKDPREAAEYLNACYQDSEEQFLVGLKNVVDARGGISGLAKSTDLNRENLYRVLSSKGNPKFYNLITILDTLGINLSFKADAHRKKAA